MATTEEQSDKGSIVIYQSQDGITKLSARLQNETIWLTQKSMAELFGVGVPAINKHLSNIFDSEELQADAVISKMETTAADGKNYLTNFYNLDAIIAVGYRVNSKRATQFRIWATQVLKEYLIKGFALNDERLKNPHGYTDYFEELLARIRDIRVSEMRFYQKLRDLFAMSIDYAQRKEETDKFFAEVQNKLLYAVTHKTAAELVVSRADADLPNMGLTAWKGTIVRKEDIYIAKNYLTKNEIDMLNRLTTLFLDSAELRVQEYKELTLDYWLNSTDDLLRFQGKEILQGAGTVSKKAKELFVEKHYAIFDQRRNEQQAIAADLQDEQELKAIEQEVQNLATRKS
ncbi:MAG: virulence RhuM family protein [Paludibacteraceae bacterium]